MNFSSPRTDTNSSVDGKTRVIDLSQASGSREAWGRPALIVYLWTVVELLLVTNPWQPSTKIRRRALMLFGAKIGHNVILRPRLRVKFPWHLTVGDRSWIGEDVWIHNQDNVRIGADAVISQGTFLTTGSHAYQSDMSLTTQPIAISDGAWITARCVVLGGSTIGTSAVILAGTVVKGSIAPGEMFGGDSPIVGKLRFRGDHAHPD